MNIKEIIEKMKAGEKIAVHCETEERARIFLKLLHEEGFKWRWSSGDNLCDYTEWYMYASNTCYIVYEVPGDGDNRIDYNEKNWCLNSGYEVVEFIPPNCRSTMIPLENVLSRQKILEEAIETITQDRQDQYGQPEDSFGVIAEYWSIWKGIDFSSHDVAMMLALLKVARIQTGKPKNDNYVDLAGYAACAGEVVKEIL